MMKYKGYTAEVEFDESVGRLHGRSLIAVPIQSQLSKPLMSMEFGASFTVPLTNT